MSLLNIMNKQTYNFYIIWLVTNELRNIEEKLMAKAASTASQGAWMKWGVQ